MGVPPRAAPMVRADERADCRAAADGGGPRHAVAGADLRTVDLHGRDLRRDCESCSGDRDDDRQALEI